MSKQEERIRVGIYIKQFSEKEERLFPDKNQEEICRAFIDSKSNKKVVSVYQDDYQKGSKNYLKLNRLIRDVENNELDLIITPEAERFDMGVISAYKMAKRFLEYGVTIQFIENDIFTRNPEELLKLEIMAQMMEKKKKYHSEQVKAGIKKKQDFSR